MTVRLGINGFGRIGRQVARIASRAEDLAVVAVNTRRPDPARLAHLLRYDSVHGPFEGEVRVEDGELWVAGRSVRLTGEEDPGRIDWWSRDVDVVVEASGAFVEGDGARRHLDGGAPRVVITAPAADADATLVVGANEGTFDPARHHVVSAASCTTACLAPVVRVLHRAFEVRGGFALTVHAYTRDQELVDGTHDDLRRARAAALNIVPTRTGAARILGRVLPDLDGRISATAVRVPVADVSLLSLSVSVEASVPAEEVNDAFREAARGELAPVLGVTEEPLVSSDFVGDPRSAVVDLPMTRVDRGPGGSQVQVLAWYDNEFGYANRVVDLIRLVAGAPAAAGDAPAVTARAAALG
ncbi:MAG TPA: type I glyceraldehyde-3-phosphate dehydrogenase [Actinomycetota bacterium]|nr:type I glyceraldehyde-3-phosphate dehydrogenase [Actinomycetota bacterium]